MARIKDWAKVGSVAFVISLIGVLITDTFGLIDGISLGIRNIIFIVLVGIAMYVAFLSIGEAKKTQEISFTDVLIYGGVLFGIGYMIIKFNLAPSFSIALQSIIP